MTAATTTRQIPDWPERSACKGADTELFYPAKGGQADVKRAKAFCDACPVAAECLADELARGIDQQWEVRGGLARMERIDLIRTTTATPEKELKHEDRSRA
jgi:WhiB family transcriptional regulator, redox-sensing transcriptional regulator